MTEKDKAPQQLEQITDLQLQYWIDHLDFDTQMLHLPGGGRLSRDDLTILHMLLHNYPRKVIAHHFRVSVKAIEKRLFRCKVQLSHRHCDCYNLHGCIRHHRLTNFLMANADWFETNRVGNSRK